MNERFASRPQGLSRRRFLGLASAAAGLFGVWGIRRRWPGIPGESAFAADGDRSSASEQIHLPVLKIPSVTSNGAKVPIVVEMAHPMEPAHYVTSVQVVNGRDPIPLKGVFHFTPANGQVYLAFQARMDQGSSQVVATAQCSRHGASSSSRSIDIPIGAGGCAAPAPPWRRISGEEISAPRIRIPELVERGWIRRDEIIHVQLKMRHPSRTGLIRRDGIFVRESDPIYLSEMEVFYGDERVSRFTMTAALSDDPFITFKLWARREGPLRILVINSRGQKFEAREQIRLS